MSIQLDRFSQSGHVTSRNSNNNNNNKNRLSKPQMPSIFSLYLNQGQHLSWLLMSCVSSVLNFLIKIAMLYLFFYIWLFSFNIMFVRLIHLVCCVRLPMAQRMKGKKVLLAQSCPTLRDLMDCSLPGSSVYSLLQGIFPTQESNPGLLHCRQILYHLSHQGSPMAQWLNISHLKNISKMTYPSTPDGHLVIASVLVLVNTAAVNILIPLAVEHMAHFCWDYT